MLGIAKRTLKRCLSAAGYDLIRVRQQVPDFDAVTLALCDRVKPYTITSPERISALRDAVKYVLSNKVPGDIVECGVWKGGCVMVCALTILDAQERRNLWLFDTFEGMTPPTDADVDLGGQRADSLLNAHHETSIVWAVGALDDVKRNVETTGYPKELIRYVKGRVEDTIPGSAPERIALLRLDTDWYESTYHELVHLYPRLSPGGVLIIDDYGHWVGSRKAADQYFAEQGIHPLLHRTDYTARMLVKHT
jgi:O-methyltransferase